MASRSGRSIACRPRIQVRSNLAKGGRAEAVQLTPRDQELCALIRPSLKAAGLLFVGIDVIGDTT